MVNPCLSADRSGDSREKLGSLRIGSEKHISQLNDLQKQYGIYQRKAV
jgi:hypothetical protein